MFDGCREWEVGMRRLWHSIQGLCSARPIVWRYEKGHLWPQSQTRYSYQMEQVKGSKKTWKDFYRGKSVVDKFNIYVFAWFLVPERAFKNYKRVLAQIAPGSADSPSGEKDADRNPWSRNSPTNCLKSSTIRSKIQWKTYMLLRRIILKVVKRLLKF